MKISLLGQSKLSKCAIMSKLELMKVSSPFGLFEQLVPLLISLTIDLFRFLLVGIDWAITDINYLCHNSQDNSMFSNKIESQLNSLISLHALSQSA